VKPFIVIPLAALAWGVASSARAECVSNGVQFFPAPGAVLPTNTQLVMEGIGKDKDKVAGLVGAELALKSTDDIVSVKVLKGWTSGQKRVAVILKPTQALKPEHTYTLLFEAAAGQKFSWRTGKSADQAPPKFQENPAVAEGEYLVEKNGPTKVLRWRMVLSEESPAYLVATLKRSRGQSPLQTYFMPVNGGTAVMGHDACSGSFDFEDGRSYKATLELFDAAGNAGPHAGPIEINAPKRIDDP
jgi:hypothetical protein